MNPEELHKWLLETEVSDELSDDDRTLQISNLCHSDKEAGCLSDNYDDDDGNSIMTSLDDACAKSSSGVNKRVIEEIPANVVKNNMLCFDSQPSINERNFRTISIHQVQFSRKVSEEELSDSERAAPPVNNAARMRRTTTMGYNSSSIARGSRAEKDARRIHHIIDPMDYTPRQHRRRHLRVHHHPKQSYHSSRHTFQKKAHPSLPYDSKRSSRRVSTKLPSPVGQFKNAMEQSHKSQEYVKKLGSNIGYYSNQTQRNALHDSKTSREMLMKTMQYQIEKQS